MLKLIITRILMAIPTLLIIIAIVFFMVHLSPGNPFQEEKAISPEALKQLLHQYHLDLPIWKQFLFYLNDILHGNLGQSYKFNGQPINSLLFPENMGGFWVTMRLGLYSMAFAIPLGIIVGAYSGLYKNSIFDKIIMTTSTFFSAVPTMVTGPLAVLIFAVTLQWLPSRGWNDGEISHIILPTLILGLSYLPTITFITRASIIEVLNSNYIRTAKAKGLPINKIIFKHALRPTLIPVVSLLGPMFAGVLIGAVITEQIFNLPGLGVLTTNAATNRDYNMIMGITLFGSFLTIIFNILVDILYFFLDPKIKR